MIKRLIELINSLKETVPPASSSAWHDPTGHRRAPRLPVRFPLKAVVLGTEVAVEGARYSQALSGYTKDMSNIGLSCFLPDAPLAGLDLTGEHRRLKLVLVMPSRPIEVFATAVHHRQTRFGSEDGWLVGARITKMSKADRERLIAHLQELDKTYPW